MKVAAKLCTKNTVDAKVYEYFKMLKQKVKQRQSLLCYMNKDDEPLR
jgi:hypothetical protein